MMKFETHFGCTAQSIIWNDRDFFDHSIEEQRAAQEKLLQQAKMALDKGEISMKDILELFQPDDTEYSNSCEQCGNSVVSNYWEFANDLQN